MPFRRHRSPDRTTYFRKPFRHAVASVLEKSQATLEDDIDAIIRLYGGGSFAQSTSQRSLSWQDQDDLREAIARYNKFRQPSTAALSGADLLSSNRRFSRKAGRRRPHRVADDLAPVDVMAGFLRAKHKLQRFASEALGFETCP